VVQQMSNGTTEHLPSSAGERGEGGTMEETCGYTCFAALCVVAGTPEIDIGGTSFGEPNGQGDERSKKRDGERAGG